MGLIFKKISKQQATVEIAGALDAYLAKGTVLLSLSGGSAIATEVEILKNLKNTDSLTITLNDERFGQQGHTDSNWRQLKAAGLDSLNLKEFEILNNESPQSAVQSFNQFLKTSRTSYDYLVSILGMGADGHTSGILPDSLATTAQEMATYYEASDYKRITNTPKFLYEQDEIWLLVYGDSKHAQIEKLSKDLDLSTQPVQLIKQVRKVTFYNDLKGDD